MKTKEEMQAIVNQIRDLCKLHGVALLPEVDLDQQGYEIVLVEAVDLVREPNALYSDGVVKPENLLITNKVVDHLNRNKDGSKALDRFTIKGIGDVEGHTKPRMVVSQYIPGFMRGQDEGLTVDVESIDEIEAIPFVKEFSLSPAFLNYAIGVKDGPFGTLMGYFKDHTPLVIGFIEGIPNEELLKKWPEAGSGE